MTTDKPVAIVTGFNTAVTMDLLANNNRVDVLNRPRATGVFKDGTPFVVITKNSNVQGLEFSKVMTLGQPDGRTLEKAIRQVRK